MDHRLVLVIILILILVSVVVYKKSVTEAGKNIDSREKEIESSLNDFPSLQPIDVPKYDSNFLLQDELQGPEFLIDSDISGVPIVKEK